MATILLVDDEPMLLELFREVLQGLHRILVAGSVGEALRILEQEAVDAVTCDFRLADGTGEDVLDWIRQHRPELLARTALLTGADTSGVFNRDVLILRKPLPMERLLEIVEGRFSATGEEQADDG